MPSSAITFTSKDFEQAGKALDRGHFNATAGDIVDLRRFPVIDPARGGSIQGELDALNRLLTEFVVPNGRPPTARI